MNESVDKQVKKVFLVTGATGNIGRYIVYALSKEANVLIIAGCRNREKGEVLFKEQIKLGRVRLAVFNMCSSISKWPVEIEVDYVIHAAALCDNDVCRRYPEKVIENNIVSTLRICEFAEKKCVKKLLIISSASVYGQLNGKIAREDIQGNVEFESVRNVYAESKRVVELIGNSYIDRVPICIVRPFHIIEPNMMLDKSSMWGEFLYCIQEGKDIYIKSTGEVKRNFSSVLDVVSSILFLCEYETGCFNIGNPIGTMNILDAVEILKCAMKKCGYNSTRVDTVRVIVLNDLDGKQSNSLDMIPDLEHLKSAYEKQGKTLEYSLPLSSLEWAINAMIERECE